MQGRWWGVLLLALIPVLHQPCSAGEFAGKLVRVDSTTVTLRGTGNQKMVIRVNPVDRQEAARLLGRTVKVQTTGGHGGYKVKFFRACRVGRPR
ncbi:hypothetical protein ACFL2Q_06570 [Thermodesulfobacteriota bacterium]